MDLARLLPLADVAPPKNEGSALPVVLLLVGALVVIGIVVAIVVSRRK